LFVDRDHAVEDVLDDGANARLDAFKLGQLTTYQHEAVTVRNDQKTDREDAEQRQGRRFDDAVPAGRAGPLLVKTDFVRLKFFQHLADVRHQGLAVILHDQGDNILARSLGLHFRPGRIGGPALDSLSDLGESMRLLGSIGDEDGEIAVIRIKIGRRAPVSFCERIAARQEITALLLLHFNDGALELGQEI
jgi:hypothetical protein